MVDPVTEYITEVCSDLITNAAILGQHANDLFDRKDPEANLSEIKDAVETATHMVILADRLQPLLKEAKQQRR